MKTIILFFSLLIAGSATCLAQCDKKIIFTSSKTEHLDAGGATTRTDIETAVVEINKSTLTINVNNDHKMTGAIKSNACAWKLPFKEGTMIIKATLSDEQGGEDKNVTINIEGKDGKVTLLFEMEGQPGDKIRVTADKFDEAA